MYCIMTFELLGPMTAKLKYLVTYARIPRDLHDLDIRIWPRYSEDIPAYHK